MHLPLFFWSAPCFWSSSCTFCIRVNSFCAAVYLSPLTLVFFPFLFLEKSGAKFALEQRFSKSGPGFSKYWVNSHPRMWWCILMELIKLMSMILCFVYLIKSCPEIKLSSITKSIWSIRRSWSHDILLSSFSLSCVNVSYPSFLFSHLQVHILLLSTTKMKLSWQTFITTPSRWVMLRSNLKMFNWSTIKDSHLFGHSIIYFNRLMEKGALINLLSCFTWQSCLTWLTPSGVDASLQTTNAFQLLMFFYFFIIHF